MQASCIATDMLGNGAMCLKIFFQRMRHYSGRDWYAVVLTGAKSGGRARLLLHECVLHKITYDSALPCSV